MMIPWRYSDDPLLRHEMTLEELNEKIGQDKIFSGTEVDAETQNKLIDFFLLDRLGFSEKKFLWMWRRNLNLYYPIYKQELEMWSERKTEKWFFDNHKKGTTEHKGKTTLDEQTRVELSRTLARVVADVFSGKTSTEGNSSGKTSSETDSNGENEDTYKNGSTGKDRQFTFNYPESNYQGGIIPYDLDNNPSVEFISAQADRLNKSDDTHTGSGADENHAETAGTHSDEFQTNGTDDNKRDVNTNDTEHSESNGTRGQEGTDDWTEQTDNQGDNLNKLVDELIAQIPLTNFFKKFTDKLKPCFQQTYLMEEVMEEDDINVDEFI